MNEKSKLSLWNYGGGGGSRIILADFSANQDMSGFPFNFKSFWAILSIFNEQNKFNKLNQNQNFLHQIYTKRKNLNPKNYFKINLFFLPNMCVCFKYPTTANYKLLYMTHCALVFNDWNLKFNYICFHYKRLVHDIDSVSYTHLTLPTN